MLNRIQTVLCVISMVMVLTAQANRFDDKNQQHASGVTPGARVTVPHTVSVVHNVISRPQERSHKAPTKVVRRESPPAQTRVVQPFHQARGTPHVMAIVSHAPIDNNRLFHRQHHKNWRPRYNFYDHQYHFYPYVNIASIVDLPTDCVSFVFDGQTYSYEEGTFYQQDDQGQYVAVVPPVGIVVNAIPADAGQIDVDGQIFWRYKGVCYIQVNQGYQVVEPVEWPSDEHGQEDDS